MQSLMAHVATTAAVAAVGILCKFKENIACEFVAVVGGRCIICCMAWVGWLLRLNTGRVRVCGCFTPTSLLSEKKRARVCVRIYYVRNQS